jgi:hypothetical protein
MDTYHVVLYGHFLALFVGIGAATIIGVCLIHLRAAQTVADAAPWGKLAGNTEKVFPIAILGLFGTGAYMTSDVWTWSTRWIDVGIAVLVLLGGLGFGVAGRRAHMLKEALMENGPGPLGEKARRLTCDPALWSISFANPGMVLGVMWNMTQKPGLGGAIAAVAGGFAVGGALGLRLGRAPGVEAAPVGEPA